MMRTRSLSRVALLTATIAVVVACSNPMSGVGPGAAASGSEASLNVSVGFAGVSPNARTIVPTGLAALVSNYEISLTRSGYTTIQKNDLAAPAMTWTFTGVAAGTWIATVTAKDAGGNALATGSNTAIVSEGATGNVTVQLAPVQSGGSGTATITFTIPQSVSISSVLGFLDGTAIDPAKLTATMTGGVMTQLVYASGDLGAGSPLLQLQFKKGSVVMAAYSDSIWIFNNIPTTTTIALGVNDFGKAPTAPTSLAIAAQTDGHTMNLSWTDSSNVEEAYTVERSVDNVAWTILDAALAANAASYVDPSAPQSLSLTYYRVSAVNHFGSTASSVKSAFFTKRMYDNQIAADKTALAIGYAGIAAPNYPMADSASGVTRNITLPTNCANGSTVTWASDHTEIIQDSTAGSLGAVTMPGIKTNVTLTATIAKSPGTPVTKTFVLAVLSQDWLDVIKDKSVPSVTYASGDSAASVTKNLVALTASNAGNYGTTITWSASDAAINTSTLAVTRGVADVTVTLTATVSKGVAADTVVFSPKVIKTDESSVNLDTIALAIGYAGVSNPNYPVADSASGVTRNVTLPLSGSNGTTISWATSSSGVVAANGTVTRPTVDTAVTLTATIGKNAAVPGTKVFSLTVLKSDQQCVDEDVSTVGITYTNPDTTSNVTQNLSFTFSPANGTTVTWASGNTTAIAVSGSHGLVTRQPDGDKAVTMTATVHKRSATHSQAFYLTVTKKTDEACVGDDFTALAIVYAAGDSQASVTRDLVSLSAQGTNLSTITWSSADPTVVNSATKTVVRQTTDRTVRLTATLTKGASSQVKTFDLVVKLDPDKLAVSSDAQSLAIIYNSPDTNNSSVTVNVGLPLVVTGGYGSAVTWDSDKKDVIFNDGMVLQQATDQVVHLVATIRKNLASATRDFYLTVVANPDKAAVRAAKLALAIVYQAGDSASNVTKDIGLTTTGSGLTTINWLSSNSAVITSLGRVYAAAVDRTLTMTATVSRNGFSESVPFALTVKANQDLPDATADAASASITFHSGDTISSVTHDVTPNSSASHGSTVTWSSSNAVIITASGRVTPPVNDTSVVLTATATKNGVSAMKSFTLMARAAQLFVNVTLNALQQVTFSGSSASIQKSGAGTMTLTTGFAGATAYSWWIDGAQAGSGPTCAIYAYNLDIGIHNLTLAVTTSAGLTFTGSFSFAVTQ